MGPDPRTGDLSRADALLDHIVGWTCGQVDTFLAAPSTDSP
jgi:hypothetical protein